MNKAVDIPEYDIFTKTKDDDKPGMSYEDKIFLKQMNDQFTKDSTGSCKLLDKSGPVNKTLLRETPLNFAEESNTPLICSGFLG
jgi:hypothetical protein